MLLSLMRRHAKSYLIKFLIAIIAIVFIFYFGYSFRSREGLKVALVNGEIISEVEYQKAYRAILEAYQKQYKGFWNDSLIKSLGLKNQALESLIREKLISQESRRIGLDVTEREVQERILSYPVFQFQGRFDEGRYRALLQNNHMTPEEFEEGIAAELLRQKMEQFLMSIMPITDQEVLDYYTFSNEQVKISFVRFSPKNYESKVKAEPDAMKAYFEEHKEDYRIPDKIKIAYIEVNPDQYGDKVSIHDKQLMDYYEENVDLYKEKKQVRARHILFKLDAGASEAEETKVKEKAKKVLERARKGENFETLAKEYSEGPTKDKGGDLGYFSEGQMVKPFEEAAFAMKKGEISDLVRTSFGYHIIEVEDIKEARTKPFEEVRKEIQDKISTLARSDYAHEEALSLIDQMPYDADLTQYAKERGVPVKFTKFFAQDEPIPDIQGDSKLRNTLFSMQKNDITDLLELNDTFYIIQIADSKPSYLPELDEVREKVNHDYIAHLAKAEAKNAAEVFLKQIKEGKPWEEEIKSQSLEVITTSFFKRSDNIIKIGYLPELKEAAFTLSEKRLYPDKVFESEVGAFVVRWEESKGIDKKSFEEEKEKYRDSLLRTKHRALLGDWIETLRKKADVEIINPMET